MKSKKGDIGQLEARFSSLVQKHNTCWIWRGYLNHDHYGMIRFNGRMILAHRASFLLYVGEIPNNKNILHHCDNRFCVNPDHLYLGDQKQNIHDMIIRGRLSDRSGSKNGNSRLTEKDVAAIRDLLKSQPVKQISQRYKVGCSTIYRIKNNINWRIR